MVFDYINFKLLLFIMKEKDRLVPLGNFIRLLFLVSFILMTQSTWAQFVIQGTVKSATDNQGLIGATVMERGTRNGTTTDFEGKFQLTVNKGAVLEVSYIGFKTSYVDVIANKKTYDIFLSEDSESLDEVVVIGYGVQKKKLVTGATIQVKSDDLVKMNAVSVLGALQSQSPGVNIVQESGQPGQGFKVNIRGIGTVGDSSPLYVIDGVAGGDINSLNPTDIESIDILKDAASSAIYGSRAANGVVLVTTKQGKAGKPTVTYDMYFGWQYMPKKSDAVNAKEYMSIIDTINKNDGMAAINWQSQLPGHIYNSIMDGSWEGTDWLDETSKKGAPITNHSINIAGGNDMSLYSLGFSYTNQQGILGYNKINPMNSDYQRYTARINTDHVLYKNNGRDIIKFGETLNYSHISNNGIAEGDIYWNSVHNMLVACPLMPAYTYDENGNVSGFYDGYAQDNDGFLYRSGELNNPMALDALTSRGLNESTSYSLRASAYLTISPIKDLTFKSQFGYSSSSYRSRSYKSIYNTGKDENYVDKVSQSQSSGHSYSWENTLAYHFTLKDVHIFDAVVGQSIEKWGMGSDIDGESSNLTLGIGNFNYAWLNNCNPANLSQISVGGSPDGQGRLASFFGRVNYSFQEKYLASVTVRADGSSNFAPGKRWGTFPSLSAGWVITNEKFMASTNKWMDFLKVRASWGQNGNCNISNFQYYSTIAFDSSAGYYFGNKTSLTTGAVGDVLANPDVSWETSEQINLGFDSRFLNNRLGVTFDWYTKSTKDWLVRAPIAGVFGLSAPYINGGDVKNTGVELALNWNDSFNSFQYGANLNFSYNKNKVTRLANAEGIIHGETDVLSENTAEMYRAQVGFPIGYFWGYKTEGIFQNENQINDYLTNKGKTLQENPIPGDVIFKDVNGDKVIDENDKTLIGNPHPDFTMGFSLYMNYKGFDFNINGRGAFGQQIAKSYRSFADKPQDSYTKEFLNCWSGEGTSNKLPRLTQGSNPNWAEISDIYIEDGDYVKIQNITIGYDLKKAINKLPLSRARVYVSLQNPFTFTNYSGLDPEIGYGGGEDWVSGIDLGSYPNSRSYMVGLNLIF